MKILLFIFTFALFSCGQTDTKQKELELKERELALKEKEFTLKQKIQMSSLLNQFQIIQKVILLQRQFIIMLNTQIFKLFGKILKQLLMPTIKKPF
ncbi:MAG: hypothetical protein IPP81_19025 [Chitinophagaceae bacterium]|nr:hypothetical protein [Chitinophagaceae bacterium]